MRKSWTVEVLGCMSWSLGAVMSALGSHGGRREQRAVGGRWLVGKELLIWLGCQWPMARLRGPQRGMKTALSGCSLVDAVGARRPVSGWSQ